MHKQLQAVQAQQELLSRAQNEAKIESLRKYIVQYNIFPSKKKVKNNPNIGMSELKKLAKEWNLNRHSNFWAQYPTKEALAEVLIQYVEKMQKRGADRRRDRSFVSDADKPQSQVERPGLIRERTPRVLSKTKHRDVIPQQSPRHHLDHIRKIKWELKERKQHPLRDGPVMSMQGSLYLSRFKGVEIEEDGNHRNDSDGFDIFEGMEEAAALERRRHTATEEEVDLKRQLAQSLSNLSKIEGSEDALVKNTDALFELALYDNLEVRNLASTALVNLTVTDQARRTLVRRGVLATLFALSSLKVVSIRVNCAVALGRLTLDFEMHELLLMEGVHAVFKNLLGESMLVYEVELPSLMGLINLAGGPKANFNDSVFAVLPSLLKKRPDLATCEIVGKCIRNLSIMPASRPEVVDAGCLGLFPDILKHSYSPEVIEYIATTLANLSTMTHCQADMLFKDALVYMEKILEEEKNDMIIRRLIASALASLACGGDDLCRVMLKKDALKLVLQLQGDSTEIDILVSIAISNLAWPTECRPHLIKDEVINALGNLMSDGQDDQAQKEAVSALCNLAVYPDMRQHSQFGGVIDSLVGLSNKDSSVSRFCAIALYNLSCSMELHQQLLEKGAVPATIQLITQDSINEENKIRCLDALFYITCSPNSAAVVLEAKGAEILVDVCVHRLEKHVLATRAANKKKDGNKASGVSQQEAAELEHMRNVLRTCARIFYNITTYRPGRPRMVRCGVVPTLISLSRLPGKETKWECTAALSNLSEVLESLEMGLLETLIQLTNTSSEEILLQVASCLAYMSIGRGREYISNQAKLVAPALNALMRTGDERTQVASAVSIVNMATMGSQWNWPVQAIKDFIVISLLRVNSDTTKLLCTKLLYNVLVEESQRAQMMHNGVLYAVIRMGNTQEQYEVREVCVQAMYNLSCDASHHQMLVENGFSQMLIRVSKACHQVVLQRKIVQTLQNLVHNPDWHEKMLEDAPEGEGLLSGLKHLGRFMDLEVRVRVGQILLNLSVVESTREIMITPDNAILPLCMLLVRTDSEELQFLGCTAICNVSTVPQVHRELLLGGVLQAMVKVIRRSPLASTAFPSVKCIYNIIAQNIPCCEAVVEAEGVFVLVALAQDSNNEETIRVAIKALAIICVAEGLEDQAVTGGGALGLAVGVNYINTVVLLDRVMYALCQLTTHQIHHRQLVNNGILDVIVNLSMPQDLSISENFQFNCSTALRNLSTSDGFVHEQIFSCPGAVPTILKFSSSEQPRTRANIAVFLHNLAQDDDKAQRSIVKRGGISKLIELSESETGDIRVVCAITLQMLSKYSQLDGGNFDTSRFIGSVVTMLKADGAQVTNIVNNVTKDVKCGEAPYMKGQSTYFEGLVGLDETIWFPHSEPVWSYFSVDNKGNEGLGQSRIEPKDGKMEPIKPHSLEHNDGDLITGVFSKVELPLTKRDVAPLVVEEDSVAHSRRSSQTSSVSFADIRPNSSGLRSNNSDSRSSSRGGPLSGKIGSTSVELPPIPPPNTNKFVL